MLLFRKPQRMKFSPVELTVPLRAAVLALVLLCNLTPSASGLEPEPDAVFIRVVDVGGGLCCVVLLPDDQYFVYDTGNFDDHGASGFAAVQTLVPSDKPIDLMVLSHSDSDHIAGTEEICGAYKVKRIMHSGLWRSPDTWQRANAAILAEEQDDGAENINLEHTQPAFGTVYDFGDAKLTYICGYHKPPTNWDLATDGEDRNAGSIIMRLEYKGKSVLFCGDAVGRHIGDGANVCIATEKFMVDQNGTVPITSDVIIAPHHGADNGSSKKFVQTVKPTYVIFSAGHKHKHPTTSAAKRYMNAGVLADNMFRTDRGDNEGSYEWSRGATSTADAIGDDDIDILITKDGELEVAYRQ